MKRAVLCAVIAASCHHGASDGGGGLPSNVARIVTTACGHDDLDYPVIDSQPQSRMRNEIDGALGSNDTRRWDGMPLPAYVVPKLGTEELFVLDRTDGGLFALYRDPYDVGSCRLRDASNCRYTARLYDVGGQVQWSLAIDKLLSRSDNLEIQDVRLLDGVLYFNEACQSYARDAGGTCSSLVAVDPRTQSVLWRSEPVTSNSRFRVRGCYIVTGYGFTSERDTLAVVDRKTGRVVAREGVPKAPSQLVLEGKTSLVVTLSSGASARFRLDGFDTNAPALVPEAGDGSTGGFGYGGAGYGGAMYGGASGGAP